MAPDRALAPDGPIITNRNGELVRRVKDLRWLLRHGGDVARFEVRPRYGRLEQGGAYLVAHLRDGQHFEAAFADHAVLRDWLYRPLFRGLAVEWFGWPVRIVGARPSRR